jgi:hypothetical protein
MGTGFGQLVHERATVWTAAVKFSAATKDFYLLHIILSGCDVHSASYSLDTSSPSLRLE